MTDTLIDVFAQIVISYCFLVFLFVFFSSQFFISDFCFYHQERIAIPPIVVIQLHPQVSFMMLDPTKVQSIIDSFAYCLSTLHSFNLTR